MTIILLWIKFALWMWRPDVFIWMAQSDAFRCRCRGWEAMYLWPIYVVIVIVLAGFAYGHCRRKKEKGDD